MIITHENVESWIKSAGCGDAQYKRFCELYPRDKYPDGVPVTEAACAAVGTEFNWGWTAKRTLEGHLLREYVNGRDAIRKDYQVELENMYADDLARRRELGDYQGRSGSWKKVNPLGITYYEKIASLFGRLAEQMSVRT